jgi:hypothetical protein
MGGFVAVHTAAERLSILGNALISGADPRRSAATIKDMLLPPSMTMSGSALGYSSKE